MAITATKDDWYTDADYEITRQEFAGEAGGAGTTEYTKFRSFMAAKLRGVHTIVTVAGTTTDHAFDVYHGTTSIGSIALGTNTAGYAKSMIPANGRSLAAMDQVSVKSLADTDGKAHVIFEYTIEPGALHN